MTLKREERIIRVFTKYMQVLKNDSRNKFVNRIIQNYHFIILNIAIHGDSKMLEEAVRRFQQKRYLTR